jgi:hypothetical protein
VGQKRQEIEEIIPKRNKRISKYWGRRKRKDKGHV